MKTNGKVHWSKDLKKSIHTRLLRGTDPEYIKAAFSKLVDDLDDPSRRQARTIAQLRTELSQLKAKMKAGKR